MNKKHEAIQNWSEMFKRPLRTPRLDSQAAVLLCSLAFLGAVSVSAQTRKIELNDYAKITSVSDPQISPDGETIVFTVSRPNLDQDRSDRQLVLIDIATGAQRVLTYERRVSARRAGRQTASAWRLSPRMEPEKTRSRKFSFSR